MPAAIRYFRLFAAGSPGDADVVVRLDNLDILLVSALYLRRLLFSGTGAYLVLQR
jgi:hypothetical protein